MSSTLQIVWSKIVLLVLAVLFCLALLSVVVPRSASAATLNITALTVSSSNASTTLAKIGDTISFSLTLSGTPVATSTPVINIQSMGTTSMSGSGANWTYSTTTTNAWNTGAIAFMLGHGDSTPGINGTTTRSQADLTGPNVSLDKTAPSDPTASPVPDTYAGTPVVTLTSTGSDSIQYTTGADSSVSAPTCTTGTTYSSAITINSTQTIKAVGCDSAANASNVITFTYVIGGGGGGGGSSHRSSSGGGGGSSSSSSSSDTLATTGSTGLSSSQVSSIMDLLRSFGADAITLGKVNASLTGNVSAGAETGGPPSGNLIRDLTIGSTGTDVLTLQQFLNTHGFPVAASGPGSSGQETMTFGGLTQAALAKFQAAHGITPAAGYFGPKTRAVVITM